MSAATVTGSITISAELFERLYDACGLAAQLWEDKNDGADGLWETRGEATRARRNAVEAGTMTYIAPPEPTWAEGLAAIRLSLNDYYESFGVIHITDEEA